MPGIKTQGTHVYIIDPDATGGPEIMQIECAISVDGIGGARDQIDSTCLESPARTFEAGLATPGTSTIGLNFDPSSDSHVRLFNLWKAGTKFEMAIGYSDGTAPPTLDTAGDFDFPTTRSFLALHDTFVADFPQNFALNALVTANVAFQLSGFPDLFPKV